MALNALNQVKDQALKCAILTSARKRVARIPDVAKLLEAESNQFHCVTKKVRIGAAIGAGPNGPEYTLTLDNVPLTGVIDMDISLEHDSPFQIIVNYPHAAQAQSNELQVQFSAIIKIQKEYWRNHDSLTFTAGRIVTTVEAPNNFTPRILYRTRLGMGLDTQICTSRLCGYIYASIVPLPEVSVEPQCVSGYCAAQTLVKAGWSGTKNVEVLYAQRVPPAPLLDAGPTASDAAIPTGPPDASSSPLGSQPDAGAQLTDSAQPGTNALPAGNVAPVVGPVSPNDGTATDAQPVTGGQRVPDAQPGPDTSGPPDAQAAPDAQSAANG
jgi:hypothetical protein